MMDLREKVRVALRNLINADLKQESQKLLKTLGYKSERTLKTDGTWEALGSDPTSLTQKEKDAKTHFQSGHFLFQITDEEIIESQGQFENTFFKNTFDESRIKSFIFLCVELGERNYTRSELASLVRALNKKYRMPAIVFFRYGGLATLGIIHQRAHTIDDTRNVLGKVTLIKDIDLENPNRAHIDILIDLSLETLTNKNVNNFDTLLKAWEGVLDISELNKKFYKELVEWFDRACKEVKFPSPQDTPMSPQEHVIRMICRLLFIWFIKEKQLVAEELFDGARAKKLLKEWDIQKGTNYYTAILQNLFFATLNTEINKRGFSGTGKTAHNLYRYQKQLKKEDEFRSLLNKTPFINGGLFECLDNADNANYIDCFTDNKNHAKLLSVPNGLFFDNRNNGDENNGLYNILRRYKFTIEENTPIEQDVALDPELLGLTFENLLAKVNPETEQTALRKQTGSYYTPRPIVDYMAGEALTEVLASKITPYDKDKDYLKERLRELFDYGKAGAKNKTHLIDDNEIDPLIKAISKLKILDPAVGSGAFPMGILNKLTLALEKLDSQNDVWHKMQKEMAKEKIDNALNEEDKQEREEQLKEINNTFDFFSGDFGRKLYLIQNSIFGVDVQTTAIQIAKLRVFISLAIEQKGNNDAKENYGIKPLPNLETRFVAANTLIGLEEAMPLLRSEKIIEIEKKIKHTAELYFNARTRKKKMLYKDEDKQLRAGLAVELTKTGGMPNETAHRIAGWSPYNQLSTTDWFDPEWMFGERDGFDIVIGNPPYVRHEKIKAQKPALKKAFGPFFRSTADLYTYFYKKGGDILKDEGVLCFITSNKFMRAGYGDKVRKFLTSDLKPNVILDFGRRAGFGAAVDTLIYLGVKGSSHANTQIATLKEKQEAENLYQLVEEKMPVASLKDSGWALLPLDWLKLGEKIKATGTPLETYLKITAQTHIYSGIKTGLTEVFHINETTKERLLKEDPKSAELIRPLLRGGDLKKWSAVSSTYAIIIPSSSNQKWDWSDKEGAKAEAIFRKSYKAISTYLFQYKDSLKKRGDKGAFCWELRSCAYYAEFDKPKIIYPDIAPEMRASFDRKKFFASNTAYIIPSASQYILALLNSKMMDFFYRLYFNSFSDSSNGVTIRCLPVSMKKLPIVKPDAKTSTQIAGLVDKLHAVKENDPSADTSTLEAQIDTLIYKLYGLTKEEIQLIETTTRGEKNERKRKSKK